MAEQLSRLRVLRVLRAEAAAGQQSDTPFSSPAPVLQPGETVSNLSNYAEKLGCVYLCQAIQVSLCLSLFKAAMVPLPQSSGTGCSMLLELGGRVSLWAIFRAYSMVLSPHIKVPL